jgi:hypothetical protein
VAFVKAAAGKHTIHASGNVIDNPTTGTQSFATEVTYHLTVEYN